MTIEEKRNALEQVLQSRVLRRCDQLKKMLRFNCEAEFDGRGDEISEYLIGVEAFGRPTSHSPVEDSIVRTRAYELRNKLTKYYATDASNAPIRIEVERGAYVPRFVPHQSDPRPPVEVPRNGALPMAPRPRWRKRVLVALAVAGIFLLVLVAYRWSRSVRASNGPQTRVWTPAMETFWKPFLGSEDTPVLLTYQSRLFLFAPSADLLVRHWRTNNMEEVPQSAELRRFQKRMGAAELVESRNYCDFGTVNSVFLLMRMIAPRQNRVLLKGSKELDWSDIFNNNIIFIGQGDVHPRLRRVLEAGDFVDTVQAIRNLHPKPGEQTVYQVTQMGGNDGDKYALLSRFPGPQRGHYIMMLGAAHSELPWALAEYITNPLSVRELVQHLQLPSGDLPEAFQVVLRVSLQQQVPVRIRYATHHVVAAPEYEPAPSKK